MGQANYANCAYCALECKRQATVHGALVFVHLHCEANYVRVSEPVVNPLEMRK
jgi:hypothetical protein